VTVFNFGSINIDYVYRVKHFVQPGETLASESLKTVLGGKGANQSVALARAGAPVKHLGRVAQTDEWARNLLADFGVDVGGIELVDDASGHAIIQVDENGENAIVLHGGANQSFDEKALRLLLETAESDDWLLIQNECNALAQAFALAQQKKMKVAFNPAPMNQSVVGLPLDQCELLILNEVEAVQLANASSDSLDTDSPRFEPGTQENVSSHAGLHDELQALYPNTAIALTLGSEGAILLHKGAKFRVTAPQVNVIDSTGAGDTFVGYYLAGLIENLAHEQCLQRACAAGALAVTVAGATPGIPTRAAVEEFAN